jgi:YYY domain-containing protein
MLELFEMWALVEILGILCLPLALSVFRNLPDRGWAFSKTLGVLLLAFCTWLPLMCVPVLPFNQLFIVGITIFLLFGNLFVFKCLYSAIMEMIHKNVWYILMVESLFLGMVFLLGWVRSFGPAISSFEMFMDEGFIAAIMRGSHLPPNDMWFAGYSINYYYYAHYTVAVLAKLLGQSPSIAFNTGICIVFGLCAVNLFGITCNIVTWARYLRMQVRQYSNVLPESLDRVVQPLCPAIPYGLMSMLMALVFGNLASTQQWWIAHDSSSPNLYNVWFGPTRVIANTINEFPAFSFILSCFHAHVLTLAFDIMAMGLAFNLLLAVGRRGILIFGRGWSIPLNLACTAMVLGSLFVMNGWDYPTYMGLALICIVGQQWFAYHEQFSFSLVLGILVAATSLIALSFTFYLPFYLTFISPAQGIGLVSVQSRSMLSDELLIFGLFVFVFLSLLLISAVKRPLFGQLQVEQLQKEKTDNELLHANEEEQDIPASSNKKLIMTPLFSTVQKVFFICLIIWAFVFAILVFLPNSPTFVVGISFAILGVVLMCYHRRDRSHAFALLLGATAFALVAGCEIFYLKDAFADSQYDRMNTVFKFYFQAWVLLSVACSAGLFFILDGFRAVSKSSPFLFKIVYSIKAWWGLMLLMLVLASIVYPLTAPYERYASSSGTFSPTYVGSTSSLGWLGSLGNLERTNSLDGLEYLKDCQPLSCPYANSAGDYAAIRWLNAHIQGDPVIVEAVGDDYSYYGRISAFTGLPTLMGWVGHEIQWRLTWLKNDANNAELQQRSSDVAQIYTSPDPHVVFSLMAHYKAQYLYVGPLEMAKYTNADLHRYSRFMQIVYNAEGVTIYKVR